MSITSALSNPDSRQTEVASLAQLHNRIVRKPFEVWLSRVYPSHLRILAGTDEPSGQGRLTGRVRTSELRKANAFRAEQSKAHKASLMLMTPWTQMISG